MQSKPRTWSTSSSYSHLLYLREEDRRIYLSSQTSLQASPIRPESTSYFSMTSSRCSSIRSSHSSLRGSVSTKPSSVESTRRISTPKYADDHYPLITSVNPGSKVHVPAGVPNTHAALRCAKKMAAIHNTIIRALNASYNHAPSISPGTLRCKRFVKFNEILCALLDRHRQMEHSFVFPALDRLVDRPADMERHVSGREIFKDGVDTFRAYVSDTETVQNFDPVKLRKAIESFAPSLIQHLHDTIPMILSLCQHDNETLHKIWAPADKLTFKCTDMYTFGPMVLGCQDRDFHIDGATSTFPDLPWIAEVLIKRWYARKHAEIWEFLPSDLRGQRRLLIA